MEDKQTEFIGKLEMTTNEKKDDDAIEKVPEIKQSEMQIIEIPLMDSEWGQVVEIAVDNKGCALDTLPNLEKIIRTLLNIGFNEFTREIETIENEQVRPFTDQDQEKLRMDIAKRYGKKFQKPDIQTAIITACKYNTYHPIKNLIESKKWDGIPRAETFFIDYLGLEDRPENREVTRKWLLGAVNRIYDEGCKFDMTVVLQGQQGIGKTTAINRLALEYSTSIDEEIDKDVVLQIISHWIVEIEEMQLSKKAEAKKVKKFLSATVDDFRAPYGRGVQKIKRHNVFVGTTNDKTYLKDKTGNRRFYPLLCGEQPTEKSVFEIDRGTILQIWAEVYTWYLSNETLLCSKETEEYMNELRGKATEIDVAQELIQQYLEIEVPKDWNTKKDYEKKEYIKEALSSRPMIKTGDILIKRDRVSTREILSELFDEDIKPDFRGNQTTKKIHEIMQTIAGWEYKQYKQNGTKIRGFVRKGTTVPLG